MGKGGDRGLWWVLTGTGTQLTGKRPVIVGMRRRDREHGISAGPLQASSFPFADIASQAAVTICSLERGLQKNVPCLEMTSSLSLAGAENGC